MRILFCADPLHPAEPDPIYAEERNAAQEAGFDVSFISFEELIAGDARRAVRKVPQIKGAEDGLYRGWMMKVEHYQSFYQALQEKAICLVNDPSAYKTCHHLPEQIRWIGNHTPETVWLKAEEISLENVHRLLERFGSGAVIIKDYVKSRKHEWREACYIPDASDRATVERVVSTFLERQGSDLQGGLVFRKWIPFRQAGIHPKSQMPIPCEYRLFFFNGELLAQYEYWETGDYGKHVLPLEEFRQIARNIPSMFFTMDVALTEDGEWLVVELGDGQVAGLPEKANPYDFYERLDWIYKKK